MRFSSGAAPSVNQILLSIGPLGLCLGNQPINQFCPNLKDTASRKCLSPPGLKCKRKLLSHARRSLACASLNACLGQNVGLRLYLGTPHLDVASGEFFLGRKNPTKWSVKKSTSDRWVESSEAISRSSHLIGVIGDLFHRGL